MNAAMGHWFVTVAHIPGGVGAYLIFQTRGFAVEQSTVSPALFAGDHPFRDIVAIVLPAGSVMGKDSWNIVKYGVKATNFPPLSYMKY